MNQPTFRTDPAAALRNYFETGFHIEPNFWTDQEVDDLVGATETLPSFLDRTYKPAMHPHRTNDVFLRAMKAPKLVAIMEKLLGGKVSGIQSEQFFCPPGTHGFASHQDNHYVEAKIDAFASAWTALQDVTPETGGLILWPGTHLEPILPTEPVPIPAGSASQDPNAHKQRVVMPAKYKPVDAPVKKGSIIFLHGHVVHASHTNNGIGFRRALLMTYIRRGETFRPGNFAKRSEVELYDSAG